MHGKSSETHQGDWLLRKDLHREYLFFDNKRYPCCVFDNQDTSASTVRFLVAQHPCSLIYAVQLMHLPRTGTLPGASSISVETCEIKAKLFLSTARRHSQSRWLPEYDQLPVRSASAKQIMLKHHHLQQRKLWFAEFVQNSPVAEVVTNSPVNNLKKGIAKVQAGDFDRSAIQSKIDGYLNDNGVSWAINSCTLSLTQLRVLRQSEGA